MNTHNKFRILLFFALCLMTGLNVSGQTSKTISARTGHMVLAGTSTMHDWEMTGPFTVDGNFSLQNGTQKLESLSSLKFLLPVENLKSEKKRLNETAYKALKTDDYKNITFSLLTARIKEVKSNVYTITTSGNLTIAGVTKAITMDVIWVVNPDRTITCTGKHNLKMTDFKVQPPGFMGLVKAHDEITLDFNVMFNM